MTIIETKHRTTTLINKLLEVWEDSVRATHLFLSNEEINNIKNYDVDELVVNEQNPNAKAFYEHLGFRVYKKSEIDEQGNHYSILYMRLER